MHGVLRERERENDECEHESEHRPEKSPEEDSLLRLVSIRIGDVWFAQGEASYLSLCIPAVVCFSDGNRSPRCHTADRYA